MQGEVSNILIVLLAAGLAAACAFDWRSRTIPNWLNAAIALLALPFWWASGVALWPGVAAELAIAAAVLVVFAFAFQLALALWLPPGAVLQLLVVMSVAGGVLTLAMLIPHRIAGKADQLEIPYGIAIAFAGFWLISERILNQFV
jgi:prepilin peptidase CpaA